MRGDLSAAQADVVLNEAERIAASRPDVNLVYVGRKTVDGVETDEPAVVFVVAEKMSAQALRSAGQTPIPRMVDIDGLQVATDVVEGEPQKVALLKVDPNRDCLYAMGMPHQQWFDFPLPGGCQIAPAEARWVGTLGAAVGWRPPGNNSMRPEWGALTNRHVACGEQYGRGWEVCQPSGNNAAFGKLDYSPKITFSGGENYIDAAFVKAERNGESFIAAESLGIGPLSWSGKPREPKVGDRVTKSGRTTGVTTGRVIGLKARTTVDYGEGRSGRFVDQIIVQGDTGDFSRPGDSGSLILFADDLSPAGLLFAGGGGRTTANRIAYLVQAGFVFYGGRR